MNTDLINPSAFVNFISVDLFINWYQLFLGLFPPVTHWLVSLIVLFSIAAAFFALIRTHWLFIILLIFLIPVIYPVLQSFFSEIWQFVLFLWNQVRTGLPNTT